MSITLFPVCSTNKVSLRTGETGPLARLYIPLQRYWFRNGATANFPSNYIPQNTSLTTQGQRKPDTFVKAPGICLGV